MAESKDPEDASAMMLPLGILTKKKKIVILRMGRLPHALTSAGNPDEGSWVASGC